MPDFEPMPFDPASFSGKVRLFPLPNLVLFPHILQPLHIFEDRYRALFEEAVDDDGLIAMALLAPGWKQDYEGRPPVHPIACLGRIATHHRLEDGRYNLLLQGVQRVRLARELAPAKPFREFEATLLEDMYPVESAPRRPSIQGALVELFKRALPKLPESMEQLDHLLGNDISLGVLTDLVASVLDIEIEFKQQLLSEVNADLRAALLIARLNAQDDLGNGARPSSTFPPDFSAN